MPAPDRRAGYVDEHVAQTVAGQLHAVDRRLLAAAAAGDTAAKTRIVVLSLELVRSTAAAYRHAGLPFDDLVQEGTIGLLEAIERFDPSQHVPFAAFARFRVRRSIRNALTERGRLIRLPKNVVARERLLAEAEAGAFAETGVAPTLRELATRSGLDVDLVTQARALAHPLSLDEALVPGGPPLADLVASTASPDPEAEALEAERTHVLHAAIRHLPPRQRFVLDRRFGLTGPEVTAPTLARRLGRSERRIRTIEHDALYALRLDLEQQGTLP